MMAVGHSMGRLAYADTFIAFGVRFGFTSLFEVVLILGFVVLCAATPNGPPSSSAWIRPVKGRCCVACCSSALAFISSAASSRTWLPSLASLAR